MNEKNTLPYFYHVIDSNFEEYEKSGRNEDVYIDLKNNIAKAMLDTFRAEYGYDSDIFNHSARVFMKTINNCVKSYLKKAPHERTKMFHSYFFDTLKKSINESIRLERENTSLPITFGEEAEKPCSARQKLFSIKKDYEDLQYYNASLPREQHLSEEQIIEQIAILKRTTTADIKKFIPYINAKTIYDVQENSEGDSFSVIDASRRPTKIRSNLEIPEDLIISRDSMKSILDKIDEIFQKQEDKEFLSTVITFKILSCFEPNQIDVTNNVSNNIDVISYIPDSYDLEALLKEYGFIDAKLLKDFFENGLLPQQKDLERSQGSVNNKWKQFNKKLLDKYRPELEEIKND